MIQVTHPLCDRNMITARLDAVSEIRESMGSSKASQEIGGLDIQDVRTIKPQFYHVISSVLTTLGRLPDIQRGITRIFHQTATPSEVVNGSLSTLPMNAALVFLINLSIIYALYISCFPYPKVN